MRLLTLLLVLKFDKTVFSSDKHVILCGAYVCPPDSPYYKQTHGAITSSISVIEQCLLDCAEKIEQSLFLLCGDFNARTGNLNNSLQDCVAKNGLYGVQLTPDIVQILIMLFADDVILTSYCVKGLQIRINLLKRYADNFSMTVNMHRTKIIVFRKEASWEQMKYVGMETKL